MKKTSRLLAALLLTIALTACAAQAPHGQVHCPSCGYEFSPPKGGG
jgi:hypothetical protein